MYVVYHSSDSFAQIVGVSITSLFENNKDFDEIIVYVIEKGMSEDNKSKIHLIAEKYNRSVIFITMPDINKTKKLGLVKVKRKWIFDSYCRLFLHDLLPKEVNRVLYLDGDVLVVDSLKELWELDLKGKSAAAVMDCLSKEYYALFELNGNARYCNSGVILFDLDLCRQKNYENKIKKYIKKNGGYVFFMEQSVFNVIWQDDIYFLDAKYNVSTLMTSLKYKEIMLLRKPKYFYTQNEVKEAVEHPCLLHLTSVFFVINRAWIENTNSPSKKEFLKYQTLTPWSGNGLLRDQRTIIRKIKDIIIQCIPNCLTFPIISVIYTKLRVNRAKCKLKKYQNINKR